MFFGRRENTIKLKMHGLKTRCLSGNSKAALWEEVSGRRLVFPSLGENRCSHSCDTHTRSRRRHELQTFGFSRTRPGIKGLPLPSVYMQSFKPELQDKSLCCCLGKDVYSKPELLCFKDCLKKISIHKLHHPTFVFPPSTT